MSNGEKLYAGLRKAVIKSLTTDWHPNWDDIAKPAHKGFIKDLRDDACVAFGWNIADARGKKRENLEFELRVFVTDGWFGSDIGKPVFLSDILVRFAECMADPEEAERLVANSLTEFRKKMQKEI
jgi:hypothetical protein